MLPVRNTDADFSFAKVSMYASPVDVLVQELGMDQYLLIPFLGGYSHP